MEQEKRFIVNEEEYFTTVPTRATKFWRKNWIFQFFKFIRLNYKMMRI